MVDLNIEQGRKTVFEKRPADYARLMMESQFIKRTNFKEIEKIHSSRNNSDESNLVY